METFRKIVKWTLGIMVALVIIVLLFLNYANYSDGYRVGVPIKVSHKGNLFKTYEGELNVGGLTNSSEGVLPTTWAFSIRGADQDVRDKLSAAVESGTRVKLFYKEKYIRIFWRGDTKYFVYEVQPVK
jgi:hypothetical protein